MKKNIFKLLLFVFIFLFISCNHLISDSSEKDFKIGIKGEVFIGPITPGMNGLKNKAPYEAYLKFIDVNNNLIEKIQTDGMGKFQVELNPGTYTIIPEPIISNSFSFGKINALNVKPGEIAFVEINFDSGIR